MRSLRDVGMFVGIPQNPSEQLIAPAIGLRLAGDLLAGGGDPSRSLRAMGAALDTLANPIDLQASLLTPGGVEPFQPVIRISPSGPIVISTVIDFVQGGQVFFRSPNYGAAGGDYRPTQLMPGQWQIVVRRRGVGNSGYQALERSFTATVTRRPPPPPPPPPPQVRPQIAVTQSGPLDAVTYRLTGTGFLPNQPNGPQGIAVRAVDGVNFQERIILHTSSNASGAVDFSMGPFNTALLARNAAGLAMLNFSASDKRTDPNSTPANEPLWSNTVTLTY